MFNHFNIIGVERIWNKELWKVTNRAAERCQPITGKVALVI